MPWSQGGLRTVSEDFLDYIERLRPRNDRRITPSAKKGSPQGCPFLLNMTFARCRRARSAAGPDRAAGGAEVAAVLADHGVVA
ncbi:MAG TPA: hypothetical protein PLE66_01440, partial [Thauera aminoaromatica]|nr:hypothetical protein [Thauera aminoaromatica]